MKQLLSILILVSSLGCMSARMSDHNSDRLFRDGQYDDAAASFKKGLEEQGENGRDTLLYLLDLGLSLHNAGKFEESNKVFLKADKIAEIKDYTSLATESATLLTTDQIKDYKGEDFEKILINTYLAMNYALMGAHEDALVEARRVNRKLYLMVTDGQRKYKQNAFARYLSAILYEAEGDYGDAYIDYKKTYELEPEFPGLALDLWRTARVEGMRDQMEKWDEEFSLKEEDHRKALQSLPRSGNGEIIVLYENGISPVKKPNPHFYQVPKFFPRYNPVSYAKVEINGEVQGPTQRLHDIEWTAIHNLEEKYGAIVAKKIAGIVAKEAVGYGIEKATDSPLLGLLAKLFFYVTDQADCRSWNLLPKDLQIARFPVKPGTYQVRVIPIGGPSSSEKTIQVTAGKKVFVNFRYMP